MIHIIWFTTIRWRYRIFHGRINYICCWL